MDIFFSFLHVLLPFIIGLVFGIFGGGGGVLAVPVLVYFFKVLPTIATSYSLFIIGLAGIFGVFVNARKNLIDYKTGFIFAIPGFLAVFNARKFIIPAVPKEIFSINSFTVTKEFFILVFFGIIMLISSIKMINSSIPKEAIADKKSSTFLLILQSYLIGTITGIIGAGGGFILIPALITFAKISVKLAIGTSIFIITINSLLGFFGSLGTFPIDWNFLLKFTFIAIVGLLVGSKIAEKIDPEKLKKAFGWFILIIAINMLAKEIFF